MILQEIIQYRKRDLEELKKRFPLNRLREAVEHHVRRDIRSFQKAIANPKELNLVCEIKKASPSEGILREDFQPLRLATLYEHAGASAISILTEPRYFMGRPSYLKTIRQVTTLPLLRKDFILETYQLYESALLEADAFLLISSLLTGKELKVFLEIAPQLGMDALVEVHTEEDLKKAVDAGAQIIGVNNRNLRTLEVNPHWAKRLIPHIPKGLIVVVESGLCSHEDLMVYKSLGVHAFLIGTALMKSRDIIGAVQSFLGTDKRWRRTGS